MIIQTSRGRKPPWWEFSTDNLVPGLQCPPADDTHDEEGDGQRDLFLPVQGIPGGLEGNRAMECHFPIWSRLEFGEAAGAMGRAGSSRLIK